MPHRLRLCFTAFALVAFAATAAEPLVEAKVNAIEVDDAKPPIIVEVEAMLTNRSDRVITECAVELRYLDAKGKAIATKRHVVSALDLKPGAEVLTSYQDLDLPKTWAHTVEATASCKAR